MWNVYHTKGSQHKLVSGCVEGEILKVDVFAADKTVTTFTIVYPQHFMTISDIIQKLEKFFTETKSAKKHAIMGKLISIC